MKSIKFLKFLLFGILGGILTSSCDSAFKASELVQNYITVSNLSPINRANMSNYSLGGTCFYNNQPVTAHVKGQIGDSAIPPKLSTCTDGEWSIIALDLSDLSDGEVSLEVVHLDPNGKGHSLKETVTKTSEGAAVSINTNNMSPIIQGTPNAYTLTGTCTEVGQEITVEVTDGTSANPTTPNLQPTCQAANPVGEWSSSFDHSSLSEGTLTITVTHTSSSDTTELIKDVTAPTVTISDTAQEGERVSEGIYSLNGGCSEIDEDVEMTLTDSSSGTTTTTVSCTNNSGSGQWEVIDLDISSLADGDITISVTQEDEVGNTGAAPWSISKGPEVVDPVDPVVTSGCAATDFVDDSEDGSVGSGGTGTPTDPYIVCNAVLLNKIRENTATTLTFYKLEQDIDLEGAAFEPLGAAEVGCSQTGAFAYYFDGDGKRIINYKLPMSRQDYYHPTDRLQDIFGRCVTNVVNLTVNPGSSSGQTEFCDLFDFGSSGDIGLTEAVEQSDGSFTQGSLILCSVGQLNTIDGDTNNLTKDYILYKDMDFEDVEYAEAIIDGDYTGTFDGNNKTIRNLNISSSSLHVGFFKSIQQGATVKNLRFENVSVESTNGTGNDATPSPGTRRYQPSRVGVLAGEVRVGHVINCSVTDNDADIDVSHKNSSSSEVVIGGLVGYGLGLDLEDSSSENLHIKVVSTNSSFSGSIGGLVGLQSVCPNRSSTSLDCTIGSTDKVLGKIERSYSANQNIETSDSSAGGAVYLGGLIGAGAFSENKTFVIKDSYVWKNYLGPSGSQRGGNYGGLMGSITSSFFGTGGSSTYKIEPGNLKIINSYSSGGNMSAKSGYIGGFVGTHHTYGDPIPSLFIENSFSNMPLTNFQTGTVSNAISIGGFYGRSPSSGNQSFRDLSDSYYAGLIACGPNGRHNTCGGIGGVGIGSSLSFEVEDFIAENLYSTAEIKQITGTGRRDSIGLLFGSDWVIYSQSEGGLLSAPFLDPASNVVDNPSLYFRRDGITTESGYGKPPGESPSSFEVALKSASQPCYVLTSTTDETEGCLGLAVDPENAITAGNRALIPTQFQAVPADPTTATGTSPSLGNEFLYTAGWCPRVCRDGSSSCTETSNTLVGFDDNGDPLPGPGGGLKAQAQNEGRNCFEPCFEFEGNSSGIVSNTIKTYRCEEVEAVQIPDNTTSILADAFKDLGITSVTFPESLISIGNNAFSGTEIADVIIPSGITSIGDNAFSNNSSLTSVCIETQESQVALGTTPFGSLASSAIDYQSDGDCSN